MLNNALISIIVPVYKVEYWLPKCIKSLLGQTYKNIEIILVDDGSPDNSGKICDKFAKKDSRIKVIHKENGGVSSARNVGIDAAQGDYICFVDSDDWLPKDALKTLYAEFLKNDIQISLGNLTLISKRTRLFKNVQIGRIISFDAPSKLFGDLYEETSLSGLLGKLFYAPLIKENHIRFINGMKFGEDVLFLLECFKNCHAVSLIEKSVYYYNRLVSDSAILRYYPELTDWMVTLAATRQVLADQKGENYQNRELYVVKTALIDFEYIINSVCLQKIEMAEAVKIFEKAYNAFSPYFQPELLVAGTVEYNIYYQIVERYCKSGDFAGLYKWESKKYENLQNTLICRVKLFCSQVYIRVKTVYEKIIHNN